MADISLLSRLINGIQRNVDLSTNTLVVQSLKLGTSELTKAKLDLLVLTTDSPTAVDASAQHHHDGRYRTQTELSSTGATSGADLIGTNNTPANYSPAASTVQDHLEAIDTALASAGGTAFLDTVFRIQDDGDNTKQIAFQAAAITTGTTRTITMPDADIDLTANSASQGSFANRTLSNLGTTAVNQHILPDSTGNARDVGSAASYFNNFHSRQVRLHNGSDATIRLLISSIGGNIPSGLDSNAKVASLVGPVALYTLDGTNTSPTHIETGNASAGNSGNINLITGTATGIRGSIVLNGLQIDASSTKIVNLANGTAANDAVNLGQLSSTADGASGASLIGVDQTPAFANFSGANVQAALESIDTAIGTNITDIGNLETLTGVGGATDLGTFTGTVIPDSQTIKQALQSLETYAEASRSLINNFEWANSAKDYIVDNTLAPPTEVSGDRYVLSHDGGVPNAAYDGAAAGDIVEFNGTIWVASTPTLGTFVSVDDQSDVLYYWGGSSWTTKAFEATTASTGLTKVGFDIRLADAAAANGIAVSSGTISISLATDPGLEFNAGSLRVLVDPAGALERVSAGLDVKDGGIDTVRLAATSVTAAKLAADVVGDGLSGGNGSAIAFDATATAGTGLENDGSNNLRIATSAYDGDTITGGGGSAAAVQHAPQVKNAEVAGEAFATGVYAVRYGVTDLDTPETAGRVYKADPTELSLVKTGGNKDPFHVIGILNTAGALSAADPTTVVKSGLITVTSHGLAVGEPVWLGSAGALTSTAPSTAGEAVVKVGIVKDANTIDIQIQIMGVN